MAVVCAPATAYDITTNKATHREARGLLWKVASPRAFALLQISNILPASREVCGNPIAFGRNDFRKQNCESTHLAAVMRNQRESHIVSEDDTDWQKRSEEAALRGAFMNSGISKPFDLCSKLVFVLWERPFVLSRTESSSSAKTSGVCVTRRPTTCELRMACKHRKNLRRELGKIES